MMHRSFEPVPTASSVAADSKGTCMPRLVDLTRLMDPANRELLPEGMQALGETISPLIDSWSPADRGRDRMMGIFGCSADDLPDREGWGEDTLTRMNTHCGTHVDAPLHSGRTIEGKPARTISDIGLEELFRPGLVLDLRPYVEPASKISIKALETAIADTGTDIHPGDAVLLRTGQEHFEMTDPGYYTFPGMTGDGTRFLTSKGAKILGTDAMGWDRPFPVMRKAFEETGDKNELWDGHFAIRDREAFIVQQMTNLGALPSHGFMVGFFPIKLHATSAAPARAVAFLPDED